MESNKISTIPSQAFTGMVLLTNLYLGNNPVSSIGKESFRGLVSLVVLDMHNVTVSSFEEGTFDLLHNIRILHLQNNRLKSISPDLFINLPRPSLTLYLGGSPGTMLWDCSSLCWLKHEEQQYNIRVPHYPNCAGEVDWSSLKCGEPGEWESTPVTKAVWMLHHRYTTLEVTKWQQNFFDLDFVISQQRVHHSFLCVISSLVNCAPWLEKTPVHMSLCMECWPCFRCVSRAWTSTFCHKEHQIQWTLQCGWWSQLQLWEEWKKLSHLSGEWEMDRATVPRWVPTCVLLQYTWRNIALTLLAKVSFFCLLANKHVLRLANRFWENLTWFILW